MREFYVYIYKLNVAEGRPSGRWLPKCRWLFIRPENTPRFQNALSLLERYECPMIEFEGGYLFLKISPVRELLTMTVPDLLHDVIISPEKIESLKGDLWISGRWKFRSKAISLWRLGLITKAEDKVKAIRDKFRAIYEEELKKEKESVR
jgi:hypothetical protein